MTSDLSDDKFNEYLTREHENGDYNENEDEYDDSDDVFENSSIIENSKQESNESVEQMNVTYNQNDPIKNQNKQIPKIEITDNDDKATDQSISRPYSKKDIHRYLTVIVNNCENNQTIDPYDSTTKSSSKSLENEVSSSEHLNAPGDCFIPHVEKVELLRKFSTPITDDQNQLLDRFLIQKQYKTSSAFPAELYDIRSKFNDKYKCNVCHNPFNDPRVLDCLHEFCFECLLGLYKSNKRANNDADCSQKVLNDTSDESLQNSISMLSLDKMDRTKSRSSLASISGLNLKHLFKPSSSNSSMRRKSSIKLTETKEESPSEMECVSIKCPHCEFATNIPFGGLNRLPRHLLLQRKVYNELNRIENEFMSFVQCGQCNGERTAISHCYTCGLTLCSACADYHRSHKVTADHRLLQLKNVQGQPSDDPKAMSNRRIEKCSIHSMQEFKFYCTNCNQLACQNCTIQFHNGHKLDPILRASKIHLKLFNDALERNRQLNDYANDSILRLNGFIKKIYNKAESTQNEVEHYLQQYFEALEAHKRTLLKQIAKAKETRTQEIIEQQKQLGNRSFQVSNATIFAEDLISDGNDMEILALVGTLLRRFDYFYKTNEPFEAKLADSLRFLPEVRAPETQEQNNIPMYGIIATRTAVAKFCYLNEVEPIMLRVLRKAELKVVARDIEDQPLCHGGLTINVEIKYKDALLSVLPVKISDERDGSYRITFTPDAAGIIIMSVKLQDKDIKGSPFNMIARTLRPHSGIFHCCAFCSSNGSRAAYCACDGKMPGGYRGCGHGHQGHPGRRHWSCCASTLESSECTTTNSFR